MCESKESTPAKLAGQLRCEARATQWSRTMAVLPRLIVFASGTATGGGAGFRELVRHTITGVLQAHIVAVISHHASGGVQALAETHAVPFAHFPAPWNAVAYRRLVAYYEAEWVALSGWLKPVRGLDSRRTFNIHPGPLPQFGGKGMYGHYIHEAVIAAYQRGEGTMSAVTMHFVTDFDADHDYDDGPVFFRYPILIDPDDTPETLGTRVNTIEQSWQAFITNLVVHEQIAWNGTEASSLVVPSWYPFL
jgi:phosphoribosylglycinamide formyltransferase 1